MRMMGLDVGDKTIGVAVSDALGLTAQAVDVIRRTGPDKDFARLETLVNDYEVEHIVVGLPKNMNGTIGPRAEKCRLFAESLKQRLHLPVTLWDERLTTVAAEKMLISADVRRKSRKKVIDKMAASLILQTYLDSRRRDSHA